MVVAKTKSNFKRILLCSILFNFILNSFNITNISAATSAGKNDLYAEINVITDVHFQNTFADGVLLVGAWSLSDKIYITYITDITCASGIVTLTPDVFIHNKVGGDEHAEKGSYSKYVKDFHKDGSNCNNLTYKILKQLDEIPILIANGMPASVITNQTANQTGKKASDYLAAYNKEITPYKSDNSTTGEKKQTNNVSLHIQKLNEAEDELINGGAKKDNLRLSKATCKVGAQFTLTVKDITTNKTVARSSATPSSSSCNTILTDLKNALKTDPVEKNKIDYAKAGGYFYLSTVSYNAANNEEEPTGQKAEEPKAKKEEKTEEKTKTEGETKKEESKTPKETSSSGACRYSSTQPVKNGKWVENGPSTWSYTVDGEDMTGWQFINWSGGNNWFYFDSYGRMQTGLQNLPYGGTHGNFYLDTESGAMQTGWKFIESEKSWSYFDDCSGAAVTGWKQLNYNGTVNWYYFDLDGRMYSDEYTPDGYYVNSSGAWDNEAKNPEMVSQDGEWRCDDAEEECLYYNSKGNTLSGWQKIDGEEYYFDENGRVQNGWIKKGNDWYFYEKSSRVKDSFIEGDDGEKYYVMADGRMATDLTLTNDGHYYCFKKDGTSDYAVMQKDTICKYEEK